MGQQGGPSGACRGRWHCAWAPPVHAEVDGIVHGHVTYRIGPLQEYEGGTCTGPTILMV